MQAERVERVGHAVDENMTGRRGRKLQPHAVLRSKIIGRQIAAAGRALRTEQFGQRNRPGERHRAHIEGIAQQIGCLLKGFGFHSQSEIPLQRLRTDRRAVNHNVVSRIRRQAANRINLVGRTKARNVLNKAEITVASTVQGFKNTELQQKRSVVIGTTRVTESRNHRAADVFVTGRKGKPHAAFVALHAAVKIAGIDVADIICTKIRKSRDRSIAERISEVQLAEVDCIAHHVVRRVIGQTGKIDRKIQSPARLAAAGNGHGIIRRGRGRQRKIFANLLRAIA